MVRTRRTHCNMVPMTTKCILVAVVVAVVMVVASASASQDADVSKGEGCGEGEHACLCGTPRCLPSSLVGDGTLDCVDGSDEMAVDPQPCPPDLAQYRAQQLQLWDLTRRKRAALAAITPQVEVETTLFRESDADATTKRPLGTIASSVVTFVNDRTTSEYVTVVQGTSVDGQYAHVTTKSSRVFYAEPIRLISATEFDSASLKTSTRDALQGSFATSVDPVLGKEILVTATKSFFTKQGPENSQTTKTVLKGSIPVNAETDFKFILGDSASPDGSGIMLVKEKDGRRVVYSAEANFEVVQPPKPDGSTPVIRMGTAELAGEKLSGVLVESPKNSMSDIELEGSESITSEDIELLTITIGTPVDVAYATKYEDSMTVMKMEDMMKSTDMENEINENDIPRARKVPDDTTEKEVIVPDKVKPRNFNLPTFTVKVPDQTLEEVIHGAGGLKKKPQNLIPQYEVEKKTKNVDEIRAEFNLERGDRKSNLPTVTYVGFADFTTTIADTVVIFTPKSKPPTTVSSQKIYVTETGAPVRVKSPFEEFDPISSLAPRIAPSGQGVILSDGPNQLGQGTVVKDDMKTVMVAKNDGSSMMQDDKEILAPVTQTSQLPGITYSTVETTRYNTVDLYPSGLVSSIGGTIIGNGMTTVFTTYIYGTFIQNQYAQIVQSTSSIFYLKSIAPSSIEATKPSIITATKMPDTVESTTKDILELFFENLTEQPVTESLDPNSLDELLDNSLGRAISSDPADQIIVERQKDGSLINDQSPEVSGSVTTLTYYTTFMRDGEQTVSTHYQTSTVKPLLPSDSTQTLASSPSTSSDASTLTYYTTKFESGSTQIKSNTEIVTADMINPSKVIQTETTMSQEDMKLGEVETTTEGAQESTTASSSTESVTESFSESISETSTDLSSQDVTEQPLFNLDSSLNADEDVDAIFYPRTYYITYTYFTTYHQDDTSSVLSSFETVTNIISNSLELDEHRTISPIIATPPVTYWTTYTYWTTFFRHNTTITTSSEETISNVVGVTLSEMPAKPTEVLQITPTSVVDETDPMVTVDATTYYTTYTYYTSTFLGTSTIVNSRLETITNVVQATPTVAIDSKITAINFGFDDTTEETTIDGPAIVEEITPVKITPEEITPVEITPEEITPVEITPVEITPEGIVPEEITSVDEAINDQPTGLLSTIRGSTVLDGTTTLFSTRVFGTVVDGLYFQMQSTTSEIIPPSSTATAGVLTVDAGSIISNGLTTHYTSQYVSVMTDGVSSTEIRATSTIDGEPDFSAFLNKESKTGIVRETLGSIIHGTETTLYENTVVGTFIDGLYSQVIESTSTTTTGPVTVFAALPTTDVVEIKVTPTLQASLNELTISPTPVLTPSVKLPIEEAFTSFEKDQQELSPISESGLPEDSVLPSSRISSLPKSSSRRPDIFKFIRRTSTFTFPSTLIGNIPGKDKSKLSSAPQSAAPTSFRSESVFISDRSSVRPGQPTRRHRFDVSRSRRPSVHPHASVGPRSSIHPKASVFPSSVKPKIEKTKEVHIPAKKPEKTEDSSPNSFRPFSFRRHEAAPGTRSSLPFLPRARKADSEGIPPASSRFAPTTELTTEAPEPTTPKRERPNAGARPSSASRLSAEERRRQRQRLASRPALSRLFPKRHEELAGDGSELTILYADVDGSLVTPNDPIELIFFTPEEVANVTPVKTRRKRQTDFGARVTSRGVSRTRGSSPSVDNVQAESRASPRKARQPQSDSAPPRARSRNTSPIRIPNRNAEPAEKNSAPVAPTPKQNAKPTQFTLTNSRSRSRAAAPARERSNSRPNNNNNNEAQKSLNRLRTKSSRNTVPIGNIRGRGFRRPPPEAPPKAASRFSRPTEKRPSSPRRPSLPRNRDSPKPTNNRRAPASGKNPIAEFRNRPTPEIEPEPFLLPSSDGTFDIFDPITVTRSVPFTTSIPEVKDGRTAHKEVITASTKTEVIQPDQIIQTEINGEIKLLLSTIQNGNEITRVLIEPQETEVEVTANAFTNGRRTQVTQVIPTQVFNVVTVTAAPEVQNLLQLLLSGQQQQNPFLAALGLGQQTPSEVVRTSSYVTTVTSVLSTLLPIIFRGKMVTTTVVDTRTEVVTATELITETLFPQNTLNPFVNPNPLNQLLPLLLQNQLQQQHTQQRPIREEPIKTQPKKVEPTPPKIDPAPVVKTSVVTMFVSGRRPGEFSKIFSTVTLDGDAARVKRQPTEIVQPTALPQYIHTDKGLYKLPTDYDYEDMDWYIFSAINEVDSPNVHDVTPSLDSVLPSSRSSPGTFVGKSTRLNPFLLENPAESQTPRRRVPRSAQRGTRRFRDRLLRARKIQSDSDDHDESVTNVHTPSSVKKVKVGSLKVQNERVSDQLKQVNAPTTYYTTFTYYTTLVDEDGREFIKSSLDTITQVATNGVGGRDLTRVHKVDRNAKPTETFTLDDAIVPGKPRPVPEPSFREPDPPFGPIVKDKSVRKPFQPIPDPPPPLSVEQVSESPGRPLFILRRPQALNRRQRPSASDRQAQQQERRKVVKTLKRVLPKSDQAPEEEVTPLTVVNRVGDRIKPRILPRRPIINRNAARGGNLGKVEVSPVVVTQRQSEAQAPTAVAVPVASYVGTVNTLYTVYSYLYEINNGGGSIESSTRDVTVSNRVRPSVVTVPEEFRAQGAKLTTLEIGEVTATLGQRVRDSLTTQIYLASATLVDLSTALGAPRSAEESKRGDQDSRRPSSLQSSLSDDDGSRQIETPSISSGVSRFRPSRRLIRPSRPTTPNADDTPAVEESTDEPTFEDTTEHEEPPSRKSSPNLNRGSIRFNNARNKPRFTVTRRPQQDVPISTVTPSRSRGSAGVTPRVPVRPFRERQRNRGQSLDQIVTPKPLRKIARGRSRGRELTTTEIPSDDVRVTDPPVTESVKALTKILEESTTSPALETTTKQALTRPARPAVRRDDIPIIRRPTGDRETSRVPIFDKRPGVSPASDGDSTTRSSVLDFSAIFGVPQSKDDTTPVTGLRFTPEPRRIDPTIGTTEATTTPKPEPTTTAREFRFGHRGDDKPKLRDPLLFGIPRPSRTFDRGSVSRDDESTTESVFSRFTKDPKTTEATTTGFRFRFQQATVSKTEAPSSSSSLTNVEDDLVPADYLDDEYDYYYDEDLPTPDAKTVKPPLHVKAKAKETANARPGVALRKPTGVLPPNVVWKTFTTNTYLPILGGEKTVTLSIVTSTLETLDATDAHLITRAPELFNPALLPKPIRTTATTSEEKTIKTSVPTAFSGFRFGNIASDDKSSDKRRSRFDIPPRRFPTPARASKMPAKPEPPNLGDLEPPASVASPPPSSKRLTRFELNQPKVEISTPPPITPDLRFDPERKEVIEDKVVLSPFDISFASLGPTTEREGSTTRKGITKFEARFQTTKKEVEQSTTESPFAAAINALKTKIHRTEDTEPSFGGLTNEIIPGRNQEEDTGLFGHPTTLFAFDTFGQTTTQPKVEEKTSDALGNEKFLNAFEDIFETLTSESPFSFITEESSTSTPTTSAVHTGFRFTKGPTTTESYESTPASTGSPLDIFLLATEQISPSGKQQDYFKVYEEENMISEEENYNILESVTSPIQRTNSLSSDSPTSLPDAITSTPDAITSVPDGGTAVPDWATAVPDAITSIPDAITSIPHWTTRVPDGAISIAEVVTSTPEVVTSIPEVVTAVSDIITGVPDKVTAIPEVTSISELETVSESLSAVPETTSIFPGVPHRPEDDELVVGVDSVVLASEETTSESVAPVEDNTIPRQGKNVQLDGTDMTGSIGLHGPSKNLATKTMSNGVRVIVAGDHTSSLGEEDTPVTLPPSTLSGQVSLWASGHPSQSQVVASVPEVSLQTLTFYTTLTHLSTVTPGVEGAGPLVVTSRETLTRVVTTTAPHTGNFIEMTQILLNSETYLTTQTFTRTLDGHNTATTSTEVLTQVIITEAPSVTRQSVTLTSSATPMVVTKTYLTTFTYYQTEVSSDVTTVQTDTVVSSEVVTETMFITPEPTVTGAEMVKTPVPSLDLESDDMVYATRTFYTTSTHLTTLLEGGSTVTTSSINVHSRIVTETIPASDLIDIQGAGVLGHTTTIEDVPQTEYVPLGNDVYKQLRTFFATYTHYTTLADGSVNSREVTKTKVLTDTITTTEVPHSLIIASTDAVQLEDSDQDLTSAFESLLPEEEPSNIIHPTSVSHTLLSSSESRRSSISPSLDSSISSFSLHSSRKPGLTSTRGSIHGRPSTGSRLSVRPSSSILLSPSQLSSLKASIVTSSKSPGASAVMLDPSKVFSLRDASDASSGTEATMLIDDAISSSTTKVVSDSTGSVTVLVGSSLEPMDLSSHNFISTSVLTVPTVLRGVDGASSTMNIGGTIAVVERDGQQTVLPAVQSVLRLRRPALSDVEVTPDTSAVEVTSNSDEESSSGIGIRGGAAIGLMVPVLSAVAGMIKNKLPVAGVAAAAKSDDGRDRIDLPRNTLIHMEEPHFIPVGGVAASMSSIRRLSGQPTQGFIPLNRLDENEPNNPVEQHTIAPFLRPIHEIGGSSRGAAHFNPPQDDLQLHSIGGFKPPTTTERGFTAIFTTGVIPTHVSVISGVETIIFGDGIPKPLPPPGLPAPPGGEFQLIEPSFEQFAESNRVQRPAVFDDYFYSLATTGLPHAINARIDDSPTRRLPNEFLLNTKEVESDDLFETLSDARITDAVAPTHVVEAIALDKSSLFLMTPEILLHSTVGIGSTVDMLDDGPLIVDNKRTTVVDGISTVMSGATTIFGSLFSRPVTTRTPADGMTSIISGHDGEVTKLISRLDTMVKTVTRTVTDVTTIEGVPSTYTEIIEKTLPPETVVSTVVGTVTQVNTVTLVTEAGMIKSTKLAFFNAPTSTEPSPTDFQATTEDDRSSTISDGFSTLSDESSTISDGSFTITKGESSTIADTGYPSAITDDGSHSAIANGESSAIADDVPSYVEQADPRLDNHKEASLSLAEENEVSRFVESASPDQDVSVRGPVAVSACKPRCSEVKNEVCRKTISGLHECQCRPGYSRTNPLNPCIASRAYTVRVLLDRITEDELVFDPLLHNLTHPVTHDLAQVTAHGLTRAFSGSDLAGDISGVTVVKFGPVKFTALPLSAKQVDGGVVAEVKVQVSDPPRHAAAGAPLLSPFTSQGRDFAPVDGRKVKDALLKSLRHSNYSLGGTEIFASPYVAVLDAGDFDECGDAAHNDCSPNALCFNSPGTFTCVCRDGFVDAGEAPGRDCVERTEQCAYCSYHGECIRADNGDLTCECQPWFSGSKCGINLRVLLVAAVSCAAAAVLLMLACCCVCCLRRRRSMANHAASQLLPPSSLGVSASDRQAAVMDSGSDRSDHRSAYMGGQLIPRVKGPPPKRPPQDPPQGVDSPLPQAALLDLLEGRDHRLNPPHTAPRPGTGTPPHPPPSVHSSYRYGHDRTVSALRSCDETTVRPSVRCVPRPVSSQGGLTAAERDGGSTVVFPQQELYRPSQDTDCFSDVSESTVRPSVYR